MIQAGIVALVVVLLLLLWHAATVLLLIFAGCLLAVLLSGMAGLVERWTGLSCKWSLAVVIVFLLGVLTALGFLVAPQLAKQATQLSQEVPKAIDHLREKIEGHPLAEQVNANTSGGASSFLPDSSAILSRATGIVSKTAGALFALVIVLFIGVYLAIDTRLYTNGVLRLVPVRHRPKASEVLGAVGYTLHWWLIGQLIAMTLVGVLTALGLWMLGIPLAMMLGLLAGLLDFIPNFGPIIAAVPAVLLALMESPKQATYVVLLYVVVQQIEGMIISPLIHKRTVSLPPVLTISSQILLGVMVGPLGLLLATPLMATVLVLVKMLYVEETLGDEIETPDDNLKPDEVPPLPEPTGEGNSKDEKASPGPDDPDK